MNRPLKDRQISRRIGRFRGDRRAIIMLIVGAVGLSAWAWLQDNPQHDPWAPLDLRDPIGLATGTKLAALADDPAQCRDVLATSEVAFTSLEPAGKGACLRPDRTMLEEYPYSAPRPATTCSVAIAMQLWLDHTVQPLAVTTFGQEVATVEHLGAYSCRRLYGRNEGAWSEHATGNAVDVSGFVLADGQCISVLADWHGEDDEASFLRTVRDGACSGFSTVLSPDYNAAHRDHFHFDRARRVIGGVCR